MKIFVDFDGTIFDTYHTFSDVFLKIFENYGISQDIFKDSIPHFSKTISQSCKCYSPMEHIKNVKMITGVICVLVI